MKYRNVLPGLILTLLAACAAETPEPAPVNTTNAPVLSVANGNTAFGADLYSELRMERDGNIFISPASISTAFGLAYAGARGEAAAEISEVLYFDPRQEAFHPAMGSLAQDLQVYDEGQTLRINNAVWLDTSLIVEADWLALTRDQYGAEETRTDFSSAPEAARNQINRWVEDKTEDRIKDLLAPSHVDETTRAVLVNTIYMKADWASPFAAQATQEEPFYLLSGEAPDTTMMHQTGSFQHIEANNFKAVQLPYKGNELSLIILLPDTQKGIADLESRLSADTLNKWMTSLEEAGSVRIDLKLPKLKLKDKYELAETLQRLGLIAPFAGDPFHFAGMVDPEKQPGGGVSIDKVVHQTFLEVDEKGTEAAAATAITMRKTATITPTETPIAFHADHPFLLILKHNETGTVLFLGRIADPR